MVTLRTNFLSSGRTLMNSTLKITILFIHSLVNCYFFIQVRKLARKLPKTNFEPSNIKIDLRLYRPSRSNLFCHLSLKCNLKKQPHLFYLLMKSDDLSMNVSTYVVCKFAFFRPITEEFQIGRDPTRQIRRILS
jgi:hypothetical protein